MRITTAVFETSALAAASYPVAPLPEFAFIGRSNVGKSSLINMLTRREGLAKVSASPGKTRLVNFFRIDDAWRLVDLPGYGFDAGPKADRAAFQDATLDYLARRPTLACVFVLIDSRLPPQRIDMEFLAWLATHARPCALIFTKADKQKGRVRASVAAFSEQLTAEGLAVPDILVSSSATQVGRAEILGAIGRVLAGTSVAPFERQRRV
jgi:GTP-binding protein